MEIFQLIQFQAVAELEHMTRAAERLNLAQPALSRTIQNLENELEAPLFDRSGRRMRLNENGRILLRYSRQILSSIQDAKTRLLPARPVRSPASACASTPQRPCCPSFWWISAAQGRISVLRSCRESFRTPSSRSTTCSSTPSWEMRCCPAAPVF